MDAESVTLVHPCVTESSLLSIVGLWDSCQNNLFIFLIHRCSGPNCGIFFFVLFCFFNNLRDRRYQLCRASWYSSIGWAAPAVYMEGTRQSPSWYSHILPFQTSVAWGQCPGERVCTAIRLWGTTDCHSNFTEFTDQLEILHNFLPACSVLCIDWLMPTCTHVCTALGTGQPASARNIYAQSLLEWEEQVSYGVISVSFSYIPNSVGVCVVLPNVLFHFSCDAFTCLQKCWAYGAHS